MKKILLSVVFVFAFAAMGTAQHRYIFTQYFINPVVINPGATGYNGGQNLFLNYRNNWANHKGSPKSFSLSYDAMVTDKVGLGAFVMSDTYGALQTRKALLSYSYKVKGDDYDFGIGFTTEYIHYRAIGALTGGIIDREDELLAERQDGDKIFDVALGTYGTIHKKFMVSIVLPGLVRSKLNSKENEVKEEKEFNYILGLGYMYDVPSYEMSIFPSLYVKKLRHFNTLIDANLLLSFYDGLLSGGVTYGFGDAKRLGFIIGGKMNKISFNYSYDFALKEFQSYNNGSHEISVGYNFNSK